jgi:TolB-like protein
MDKRKQIAAAVRDYLARERISREEFAFRTKLGKSTVDKLLIGLFSDRTLSIVEGHTKLSLRGDLDPASEPDHPRARTGTAGSGAKPLDPPSIAVLPFSNMSTRPEEDYLADGLSEDIITGLTRLRWLLVIARNSTFIYKNKAVDVRQVAKDLGVRYVLEGSVRTASGRIRVTGQLIDAESGKHIWADRYDRELQDIFAVQDDITERVVAAVEPHLYAEEGFRASGKQPDSIDAWGVVVHAMSEGKTRRRGPCCSVPSRWSRAMPGPMPCWAGPRGGRPIATGTRTGARVMPKPPCMRETPLPAIPATLGRAWSPGCL